MKSHTAFLTTLQAKKLRDLLVSMSFEFVAKEHTLYAAKKGKLSVSVYQKGPKVLIQGKDTREFIEFHLEPKILGKAMLGYEEVHQPEMFEPHFGIDESGKGDYFGPLVIAGVYTDRSITRHLMDAGIMDSKRISSAAKIRQLTAVIRETPGIAYHILTLPPLRYNELYAKFRNLNQLLAWGHATVIEKLCLQSPGCPRALSDQFAKSHVLQKALSTKGLQIQLDQRTKAESDIAVAAASILARDRFVEWMEKTSSAGGVDLPLGASAHVIRAAHEIIAKHGQDALGKVAKLHFKTTQQISES
ncbi:MAG: ribonuclease HIII [Akkermansiaceae bacterium]|jgi:ribonuclease HIII